MISFNVLEFDFNSKKINRYDVLPYFRRCWKDKVYKDSVNKIKTSCDKKELKKWIIDRSMYMFWARCQYEFLIAPWPFGSYKMKNDLQNFLDNNPKIDLNDNNKLNSIENIIIQDMKKIDVHEQIMMNIDIITDILYNEFKLNKN